MLRYMVVFIGVFLIFGTTAAQDWPKIYDSKAGRWAGIETVVAAMQQSDLVFIGEQHSHSWGHAIEKALARAYASLFPKQAVLAFEMFERDVQGVVDGYITGQTSESFFLGNSRPWGNYPTDYRPLIELARKKGLAVLAMNVPRRYAAFVATDKEAALRAMPKQELSYFAGELLALPGKYKEKFYKTMDGHVPPELIEHYYRAQCLKDDTMAESIAAHLTVNKQAKIIGFIGAFHSDEGLGVVAKTKRLVKQARILVISIVPVLKDGSVDPNQDKDKGHFVFFAPENQEGSSSEDNLLVEMAALAPFHR